jgi:hypothetical protein
MFDTIIAQVGAVRCALLVGATLLMIAVAQVLSFRQALSAAHYEWKAKPFRSLVSLLARHEANYFKKVPILVGACVAMTLAAVVL